MGNKENVAAAAAATAAEASPSTFLSRTSSSSSGGSSPPRSPPPPVVLSPCAACKILRRRCVEKCVLAPYFPPTEPLKFTIAHRVFGASNIIKLLQELPEDRRADAVTSMVYEANARLRDPVYGCAGAIFQLQKQINELQAELAKAQADILNFQCQNSNLFELICSNKHRDHENMAAENEDHGQGIVAQEPNIMPFIDNSPFLLDETILGVAWEPLWT